MKKLILLAGATVLVCAVSCSKQENKVNTDSLKNVQLTAQLNEATDYKDSLLLIMDDIYSGLDQIQQQENLISNMSGNEGNRRESVRQDLEVIRQRLASNRQLLNDMQKKLNAANDKNGLMLKTIDNLKAHIAQQETKIAQLSSELENVKAENVQLRTDLTTTQEQLTVETTQKNEAIQQKNEAQQQAVNTENQLNRCYYAIGTNKELKKKDLISKKFLGSTKVMAGDFDASYFQTADKRTLTTIPCNNKKVKIWTNHPAGSYEIVDGTNGNKVIKILNPTKFWSLSNHLIIQVG